jgi:rSAM/selenodomain-associated transferase 2
MRLAIVVPTLNEEDTVRRYLPAALAVADEVIVSDGGSADATVEVAKSLGARVVTGPPGRGVQLNRGAAAAIAEKATPAERADILLFLHADTTLPPGGAEAVRAAAAGGAPGGGFFLRFDADRPMQRLGGWLVNRRTRWLRVPLGDQAQWATRETFERLGGFPDWPLLEDIDFVGRLRALPGFTIIEEPVTTGARRFLEQGSVRTVAINWLIWLLFFGGVSPHRLARLYRQIR